MKQALRLAFGFLVLLTSAVHATVSIDITDWND